MCCALDVLFGGGDNAYNLQPLEGIRLEKHVIWDSSCLMKNLFNHLSYSMHSALKNWQRRCKSIQYTLYVILRMQHPMDQSGPASSL